MKLVMSSNGRNMNDVSLNGKFYNNHDDVCFQNIDGIAPIKIAVNAGNQLHVMLTVVDTWCDKAGDGAWFGIKVGGKIVTRGLYTVAMGGQRMPITLQTVVEVPADKEVEIQAVWCNQQGSGACHIGSYSEAVLSVFVNDWNMVSKQLANLTKTVNMPGMK